MKRVAKYLIICLFCELRKLFSTFSDPPNNVKIFEIFYLLSLHFRNLNFTGKSKPIFVKKYLKYSFEQIVKKIKIPVKWEQVFFLCLFLAISRIFWLFWVINNKSTNSWFFPRKENTRLFSRKCAMNFTDFEAWQATETKDRKELKPGKMVQKAKVQKMKR